MGGIEKTRGKFFFSVSFSSASSPSNSCLFGKDVSAVPLRVGVPKKSVVVVTAKNGVGFGNDRFISTRHCGGGRVHAPRDSTTHSTAVHHPDGSSEAAEEQTAVHLLDSVTVQVVPRRKMIPSPLRLYQRSKYQSCFTAALGQARCQ